MKKNGITIFLFVAIFVLVIAVTSIRLTFDRTNFQSKTYYATDSGSTVFTKELKQGEKILFFFGTKILKGTRSYLILSGPTGEIFKWDKPREMNDKNQGEYIVEQNGTYQMKIFFVAPLVPRSNAEVEVDWAFR